MIDQNVEEFLKEKFPPAVELVGVVCLVFAGFNSVTGGSMEYSLGFLIGGLLAYSMANNMMIHQLKESEVTADV